MSKINNFSAHRQPLHIRGGSKRKQFISSPDFKFKTDIFGILSDFKVRKWRHLYNSWYNDS